jgi:hypothetical protein
VITSGVKAGEKVCMRDPTLPLEEIGNEAPKPIKKEKKKSDGEGGFMIIG